MALGRWLANAGNWLVKGLEFGDNEQLMAQNMGPCFSPVACGVNKLRDS